MGDVVTKRWSNPASLDVVLSSKNGLQEKERTLRRKPNIRSNSTRTNRNVHHQHSSRPTVDDVFQFYDTLSALYFPAPSDSESREDPLTFFDESFFFLDHLESRPRAPPQSPSPSPPPPITTDTQDATPMNPLGIDHIRPRQNNGRGHRVTFASRLSNCHDHRMSTIMETATTASPTAILGSLNNGRSCSVAAGSAVRVAPSPTLPLPRRRRPYKRHSLPSILSYPPSSSSSTPSSSSSPSSSPSNKIKRLLLEYIKPYPTLPAERNWNTGARKKTSTSESTRTPKPSPSSSLNSKNDRTSIQARRSSKLSVESTTIHPPPYPTMQPVINRDVDDNDEEEWVVHGFFEICRRD